jgi:hypothetical protein
MKSPSVFIQHLVNEVSRFDELILKDIRMEDKWIGSVAIMPEWFKVREKVRRLVEGCAFMASKPPEQQQWIDWMPPAETIC